MRKVGISNFKIELIEEGLFYSRKEANQREQLIYERYQKDLLLNSIRPYSFNYDSTRDVELKRATRRRYYNKHKEDEIWLEKQKERCREKMRKYRSDPEWILKQTLKQLKITDRQSNKVTVQRLNTQHSENLTNSMMDESYSPATVET